MVLYAVLIFGALVMVGAATNVASGLLGLGLAPEFPGSWLFFAIKNYVADTVLWLIVLAAAAMLLRVFRERGQRLERPATPPRRQRLEAPSVCVALIAYNEEKAIGAVVRDFRSQPLVEQVLVVDNNSRDATAALAGEAGATVFRECRQGYGWACIRGLGEALATGADVIVLAEGDGTFSGHDIAKMIPFLENADLVVGNRVTPGLVDRRSQMDTFFVWTNQLGAKLLQLRFWDWQFLGRVRLSDLGCTFRAIRRQALARVIDDLTVGGDHFSPHMIMAALRRRLTVVEVPITFWPRVGVSKGASGNLRKAIGVGLAMLWDIITFPAPGPATAASTVETEPSLDPVGRAPGGR